MRSYKFPSKIWGETCKEGQNNSPEVLPPMTVSRVHVKTRREQPKFTFNQQKANSLSEAEEETWCDEYEALTHT